MQLNPHFFETVFARHIREGSNAFHLGDNDTALCCFARALELAREVKGPYDRLVGLSYNHLGVTYQAKGETELAASQFLAALDSLSVSFGPRSNQVRECYTNLGRVFAERDEVLLAKLCQDKAAG